MASMFPAEYPYEVNADNPEFEVFETLRSLPEHYRVYYSKKFKGGNFYREECEVDFIVFDGSRSLLCIEVKGGAIEYSGEQEKWLQNGKPLKKSPDRQAAEAMHSMLSFLGADAKDINVGWALCFPNSTLPQAFVAPSSLPKAVILDEATLMDVEQAIASVESYYTNNLNRPGADTHTAGRIHNKLTRGIGFITSVGARIAKARKQIIEVTREQFDVLEDLEANHRMVIKGVAGSGKTLIAREFASRLETKEATVLFLFYNRMLANSVRYSFDRSSTINCITFHSFAKRLIEQYDPEWWDDHKSSEHDFWELEVPLKLLDTIPQSEERFDAIIVDEGQDFKPAWLEAASTLLKDPDNGRFVVFYDDAQDLFNRWSDLPWGGDGIFRKSLTRNCRNTKAIVDYVNKATDSSMASSTRSPVGITVVETLHENQGAARTALKKELSELLTQGVNPQQIVLLINTDHDESSVAGLNSVNGVNIESMGRSYRTRSDAIRYTSINMFKGLEADVVFVLDLPATTQTNTCALYTQTTRAQTHLVVSRRKDL